VILMRYIYPRSIAGNISLVTSLVSNYIDFESRCACCVIHMECHRSQRALHVNLHRNFETPEAVWDPWMIPYSWRTLHVLSKCQTLHIVTNIFIYLKLRSFSPLQGKKRFQHADGSITTWPGHGDQPRQQKRIGAGSTNGKHNSWQSNC